MTFDLSLIGYLLRSPADVEAVMANHLPVFLIKISSNI
jgi:hypothetical protein